MTITEFLSKNGMTAEQLAAAVAISAAQLSRIRNGKSRPGAQLAGRIVRATGGLVSYADLFAEEQEVNNHKAEQPSPHKSAGNMQ